MFMPPALLEEVSYDFGTERGPVSINVCSHVAGNVRLGSAYGCSDGGWATKLLVNIARTYEHLFGVVEDATHSDAPACQIARSSSARFVRGICRQVARCCAQLLLPFLDQIGFPLITEGLPSA